MTIRAELVVSGRIATLAGDGARPGGSGLDVSGPAGLGWVDAIAVAGGRVIAAGRLDEMDGLVGTATTRIELAPDEAAIPGLTDAHLHLAEGGLSVDRLDLEAAPTLDDGLARVAAANARLAGDVWLEGHGWDADRWGRWPTADDLARAAPGRPVAIWAHDHHSLWVSLAALRLAGIGPESADPPGGLIRSDASGMPTGVLHEAAARLVTGLIPPPTADGLERGIVALAGSLVRLGVVRVHDPGGLSLQRGLGAGFEAYRRLAGRGALPIAVHVSVRDEQLDAAIEAGIRSGDPIGDPDGSVRFGWLKLFADGTLGSRTAALLEPIEPEPDRPLPPGTERGVFITPPDRLARLAERAAEAGIACQIHAIGDWAVRVALDALEPTAGRTRLLPRLEHVQLVDPADVGRFARGGIAASVQPVHLRSDAAAARRSWGARAEPNGYPWASLARSGAVLAFGTDAPVEPIDPWPGLAIAVTRRVSGWPAGTPTFGPAEAVTLSRALRAACIGGPLTAAQTDRGRLIPGQVADVVVVPAAAVSEPVEPGGALATARPRLVIVGGRIAFEA